MSDIIPGCRERTNLKYNCFYTAAILFRTNCVLDIGHDVTIAVK